MPEQPENQPVVGEDGELIQPDRTIDEAAYAEYVATYIHRDPLWFRMQEHVKEWGCAYIFVIPGFLFGFGFLLAAIQAILSIHHVEDLLLFIYIIVNFIVLWVAQKRYNNLHR